MNQNQIIDNIAGIVILNRVTSRLATDNIPYELCCSLQDKILSDLQKVSGSHVAICADTGIAKSIELLQRSEYEI